MAVAACLALVALMALAGAPVAWAQAEFAELSGIETYAAEPNPLTPEPLVTGSVAHWAFENHLRIASSSPLLAGDNYTHMVVLFDPLTGAGTCHGTLRIVLDGENGIWEGTFAGTIDLFSGEYDVHSTARGVSGAVDGMVSRARDVNTTGAYGELTVIVIAPHGF
jgi:hypothetical protein